MIITLNLCVNKYKNAVLSHRYTKISKLFEANSNPFIAGQKEKRKLSYSTLCLWSTFEGTYKY